MFYPFLLLIYLFGCITTQTTPDHLFRSKKSVDFFSFLYKNTSKVLIKNDQMPSIWYNLLFIFIFILLFLVLFICFYYQHYLINYIFNRFSKTKNNNPETNERMTILHQTPALENIKSMYLTVPKPSYFHR
jgi:hypothetical protein